MNSIFRSYPPHPWLSEWILEPNECSSMIRTRHAALFFRTMKTVGRIGPDTASPEWSMQVPVPQNCRINMLFNGFCGYLEQGQRHFSAEVIIPEPGVCWGRFSNISAPTLLSKLPVESFGEHQWIGTADSPALLAVRDDLFCLVTKHALPSDAAALAEAYLERDIEASIAAELERRSGAAAFLKQVDRVDPLTVISVECLMRGVRPAEGNIPGRWSQTGDKDTPHLDTNELFILALAWKHIDIAVAEDLMRTILKLQTSSGGLPILFTPQEASSALEAPKPLMARAAEEVWLVRKDPRFLEEIIPLLRRHLQWLLHHFDPKRRGFHCWQNSAEPFTPEIYESDLATADLATLLLTEIEAINRLQQASQRFASEPLFFKPEREHLKLNLDTQFWNAEESRFNQAVHRGRMIRVNGFPAIVPLLWKQLPAIRRSAVMDRIQESGNLPGGVSLLSWKKSSADDQPVPLLQQQILLEILKESDSSHILINGFTRLMTQGYIEWHASTLEQSGSVTMDPPTAAFILNLQAVHFRPLSGRGRLSGWLLKGMKKTKVDWFDLMVVASSILAVVVVHDIYEQWRRPPSLVTLQARMNSAYTEKDIPTSIETGRAIIKHYPEQSVTAKLMTANVLMIDNQHVEAARLLTEVRKAYPDSPGPMIALGLACQHLGLFEEAARHYAEFAYLFGEIFPDIVEMIEKYRFLSQEGFRSPPNWTEIYRYQLMHEL